MKNYTILLALCLSSLVSSPLFAEETVTILYTGSILGEIKPCGCSEEGDLGGILRRAAVIEKERAANKNILLLDAGDTFKEPTAQGKLKARALVDSMSKMNYDAAILGEKDFIYGEEFINNGAFDRWVVNNFKDKSLNHSKISNNYIKEFSKDAEIAVVGLAGEDLFYLKGQKGIRIENPLITLKKIVKELKLKDPANVVLLLTHMKREKAQELFKLKYVDIIINGHLDEENRIVDPEIDGNRILVHVRERGQYLGKITLTINDRIIQHITNEYIPLESGIDDSPSVQAVYDRYDEDSKQLFMTWLKDKKKMKNSPFVSGNACKECHDEAYTVWEKSDHAHAFNSIEKALKTFDPECLLCHTTGFKKDGGFLANNITPGLINVQCEVCHGSGRNHIADSEKPYKTSKEFCVTCHTRENSPGFDFSIYWDKIKH